MEDLSNVRFVDTPIKRLPSWIAQNMTSMAGIKRTLGVTFLNFQHSQRFKFPGPVAPVFVICATMGAMIQHEFHEGAYRFWLIASNKLTFATVEGAWPEEKYAKNKGHGHH